MLRGVASWVGFDEARASGRQAARQPRWTGPVVAEEGSGSGVELRGSAESHITSSAQPLPENEGSLRWAIEPLTRVAIQVDGIAHLSDPGR